jgi:tRNA(Ile)-lysidine synthase
LLAHHADDQAETVAMRNERHSGWRGLAGMARATYYHNILLFRPLLDIPKARLIETCHAASIPFFNDPSNENPKYFRAVLRQSKTLPIPDAKRALKREDELSRYRKLLYNGDVVLHPEGWVSFKSLAPHLLALLIQQVGQAGYPPSQASLHRLFKEKQGTLGGAILSGENIFPEKPRDVLSVLPGEFAYWAERWRVSSCAPVTVKALGDTSWRKYSDSKWFDSLPYSVRAAYPAAFQGGGLVGIPGIFGPLQAEYCPRRWPLFDHFP